MKVGLCVPAYDGRVHDAFMTSLVRTFDLAAEQGVEMKLVIGRGSPILPDVRNWCVAQALADGCDKIWFVDSDMGWDNCVPEVMNMLRAPVDIVAGVHQKRNKKWNDNADLCVNWKNIPPDRDPKSGLWEVSRVATAFVCIDRSVFERLAEAGIARNYLPNSKHQIGPHFKWYRNFFWYGFLPVNLNEEQQGQLRDLGYDGPIERLLGEDYYFCDKAKEVGAKIFVDPRVELVHFDGCVQHDASLKQIRFEQSTVDEHGDVLAIEGELSAA